MAQLCLLRSSHQQLTLPPGLAGSELAVYTEKALTTAKSQLKTGGVTTDGVTTGDGGGGDGDGGEGDGGGEDDGEATDGDDETA